MALFLFFFSLFPALPGIEGGTQPQNDEECPSGVQCKGGEQSLPACPAGYFCPGGNSSVPVPCPPGTFSSAGAAVPSLGCQPCPEGFFSPRDGQSSCQPCPKGFFSPRDGQSSCQPCPKGFFNPRDGQSSCQPCPKGFFSPRAGQSSCLPCGSGAVQPAEGQSTCVCLGPGQVYQPRDSQCTCPPGFRSAGRDGSACASRSYPVCRPPASRSQDGQCLTRRAWARYCSQKVCAEPRDFQGYDKVLGLCICHSESLERICNSQCRKRQKSILQLSCAEKKPQLLITHSNGSKTVVFLENLRKILPRPNFSLEDFCAAGEQTHPAHIVEMSGKGFLGVYDPDPQLILELLVQDEDSAAQEMNPPPAAAPGAPSPEGCRERTRSPPNSSAPFLGILNPIGCTGSALTLLFLCTPEHFPEYDVDNLFNTNAEFDWGDFRLLREEMGEIPRNSQKFLIFLFQFRAPGTYVLQLSSNKHKRMVVRALPAGARCPQEGPFLPGRPRFAVPAGIARARRLRLRPERAALGAAGAALLLPLGGALALARLCRGPGWAPRVLPGPAFRRRQLRSGPAGFSRSAPAALGVGKPQRAGTACFPSREEPMDLEDFNTQIFFELLLKQSQAVTTTLGLFQEEVRVVYHRVMNEISLLKKLWVKVLSPPKQGEEEEEEEEEESTEAKEQVPPLGSPRGFGTPQFCGIPKIPKDPWESIPPELIPLLRSVLQLLQQSRKFNLSPESPAESHSKGLMKKNQNFLHPLGSGRRSPAREARPGEEMFSSLCLSELEDKVDALTQELLQIAEDEEQFLNSEGNEDLLSYYLEITGLEKQSLVEQINALEGEIAQGRKG